VLCLFYIPYVVLVQVSGDVDYLYRLGLTELVSPEDGERIQTLNKNRTIDNVEKHNILLNHHHRLLGLIILFDSIMSLFSDSFLPQAYIRLICYRAC
jgi:hypothetical protein